MNIFNKFKGIKTSVLIFVILTYLVSWLEQARTVQNGHSQNSLDGFFLMWTPGLIGLLCSLFFNGNINDLAIKKPTFKSLAIAYGWRGFLHSQLLNYSSNLRYFITGIIWSIWHWPLILFRTYSTSDKPWLSVLLFSIMATSSSFLFGYLLDRSKSVFPTALMHASHNMWFLGITPGFLKSGPLASYFASESGLFCAVLYLFIAIFIALKGRKYDC